MKLRYWQFLPRFKRFCALADRRHEVRQRREFRQRRFQGANDSIVTGYAVSYANA